MFASGAVLGNIVSGHIGSGQISRDWSDEAYFGSRVNKEPPVDQANRILDDLSKGTPDSWKLWDYSRRTKALVKDINKFGTDEEIEKVEIAAAAVELVASKSKTSNPYGNLSSGAILSGWIGSSVMVCSGSIGSGQLKGFSVIKSGAGIVNRS